MQTGVKSILVRATRVGGAPQEPYDIVVDDTTIARTADWHGPHSSVRISVLDGNPSLAQIVFDCEGEGPGCASGSLLVGFAAAKGSGALALRTPTLSSDVVAEVSRCKNELHATIGSVPISLRVMQGTLEAVTWQHAGHLTEGGATQTVASSHKPETTRYSNGRFTYRGAEGDSRLMFSTYVELNVGDTLLSLEIGVLQTGEFGNYSPYTTICSIARPEESLAFSGKMDCPRGEDWNLQFTYLAGDDVWIERPVSNGKIFMLHREPSTMTNPHRTTNH